MFPLWACHLLVWASHVPPLLSLMLRGSAVLMSQLRRCLGDFHLVYLSRPVEDHLWAGRQHEIPSVWWDAAFVGSVRLY